MSQGKNTALLYEDFTSDGKKDLFLGMQTGGLFYFVNDSVASDLEIINENYQIKIYPNPTNNFLTIETSKRKSNFNLFKYWAINFRQKNLWYHNFGYKLFINKLLLDKY